MDLLRFIACGSVDDGKSTLLGRLLHDLGQLTDDQLATLADESRRFGTQGEALDFALLFDGLLAEREQGITIDVAYRYFETTRRKFIVADAPGHEQYTRNMVTGASTAEAAVLLVDARKGSSTQTRRHAHVLRLMGIQHLALVINKLDLVAEPERKFKEIADDFAQFAARAGSSSARAIPVSALHGDNVVVRSERFDWYSGPTLVRWLEEVEVDAGRRRARPSRFPVQWVNRPNDEFRGYAGTLASGELRPGDRVRIQPSGRETTIAHIVTADGELEQAVAGQSVTLTLSDAVDVSRGDLISAARSPAEVADQFATTLVWLADTPLFPGRSYFLKVGTRTVGATFASPKYKLQVDTQERIAARTLEANDIGVVNVALDAAVPFDAYEIDRETGRFIVIDRLTQATVACGLIDFALRRSTNVHRQATTLDKRARATIKAQQPAVVWLTGLSGAGKSTIANALESRLAQLGAHTYLLDGDNVRHGLNRDLGFTEADRVENIRRVGEIAKLMVDAGLIVIVAFISPYRAERDMVRRAFEAEEFFEVFVDASLAVAEARDPKGLYAKARRGELQNFTGIDAPYEPPLQPELRIDTQHTSVVAAAELIVAELRKLGRVSRS